METLNRMALELVDEAIEFADELAIEVHELEGGATVLDFGVETVGSIEGGLLLAEIQTGGLATVQTRTDEVAGAPLTHVELTTDHPALALLCSAKAGWEVSVGKFEALGSGPARALVAREEDFERTGYAEDAEFATLVVESDSLPHGPVGEHVADLAGVSPGSVFLPAFATASITGSVALAARAAELATVRLSELGYDPTSVLSVTGSAPVAPVAGDDETAIGRTNDALAYGGRVHVVVESDFDRFEDLPSSAREEYGRPFGDIFAEHDWDFYDVPQGVFAPAQVTVDVIGGPTRCVGRTDEELLEASFGL